MLSEKFVFQCLRLDVYSKEGNYETTIPNFMTLEEYVQRAFGIHVFNSNVHELGISIKKNGFCTKTGRRFSVLIASDTFSSFDNVCRVFNYISKVQCRYLQSYEKLLILHKSNSRTLMLITETNESVNVNYFVSDLGDRLSMNHHKAVTSSLLEVLKLKELLGVSIQKPISFLQESGEFKCHYEILENMLKDPRNVFPRSFVRKISKPDQLPMDLYKNWFGDNGRLQRDFKYLREIGKGGFGSVYKGTHIIDNQTYAIKEIQLSERVAESVREAEMLSRFKHPNIVRYHDCWKHGQMLYIRMEYVPDGTLRLSIYFQNLL